MIRNNYKKVLTIASFIMLISTMVVGMEKKVCDNGGFYKIDIKEDVVGLVNKFKSKFQVHKEIVIRDIELGVEVYEKKSNEISRNVSIIVFCSKFSRDKDGDKIFFNKKSSIDSVKFSFEKNRLENALEFFGSVGEFLFPEKDSTKSRKIRVTLVEISPFSTVGSWISWFKELIWKNYDGIKPYISSQLLSDVIDLVETKASSEDEESGLRDPARVAISGGCYTDTVRGLSNFLSLDGIIEFDPESRRTVLGNDKYYYGMKSRYIISYEKKDLTGKKSGELGEIESSKGEKVRYDGPYATKLGVGGSDFVSFRAKTKYSVLESKPSKEPSYVFPKNLIFETFIELRSMGFFKNINKK